MNGYTLTRNWYNFKFENPDKVKHVHSDLYFYIVDLWNRLGQKRKFGLPTSVTMESLGIGSYNTYKKAFNDLVEFGFLEVIKDSKNQHQSRIVALSKIDKATDKPLDKAHTKASDEATDKPLDDIEEQENKLTIKQITIEEASTYESKYGQNMINEFIEYWFSKETSTSRKTRFEKQKTFDVKKRLQTWFKNTNDFTINNLNFYLSNDTEAKEVFISLYPKSDFDKAVKWFADKKIKEGAIKDSYLNYKKHFFNSIKNI